MEVTRASSMASSSLAPFEAVIVSSWVSSYFVITMNILHHHIVIVSVIGLSPVIITYVLFLFIYHVIVAHLLLYMVRCPKRGQGCLGNTVAMLVLHAFFHFNYNY